MSQKLDFSNINLRDALDLAILMEDESKVRYLELAEQIGSSHSDDAAGFFIYMARNEEKHGRDLTEQRIKRFGTEASTLTKAIKDEMLYAEAPAYEEVRIFMSLRRALNMSLGCEKKAYDFYDSAITQINDEEVKKLFIELREEESFHQKLITALMNKSSDDLNPEVASDDIDTPEL